MYQVPYTGSSGPSIHVSMNNLLGCWLCDQKDVNRIRDWMGNFEEIRCIGKYAARLGQSLSSSVATFQTNRFSHLHFYFTILKRFNWKNKLISLKSFVIIPDIMTADSKYCFTDGIGKISVGKAREICTKYFGGFGGNASIKYASTFQIRFAGFKGVLSAWPDLVTDQIQFRPSMNKFSRLNFNLKPILH